MKKVSHSEISTYLDCQKKWELQYIKGLRTTNEHFRFGSMGHKVLETGVIPPETLYPDLKEYFGISSWEKYFQPILTEISSRFSDYEIIHREYKVENDLLVGVIDCVWRNKITGRYLITDYKFSNSDKGNEDILLDEQMYIYAVMYACENNLSLDQIDIGYISIPKQQLDEPRMINNNRLSKDKSQRVTYDSYLKAIIEHNLNVDDYKDILEVLKDKTLLTIAISPINQSMAERIMFNIDKVLLDMQKGYILEKCTFMCKKCEYLQYCKYGKEIKQDEQTVVDNNTTI